MESGVARPPRLPRDEDVNPTPKRYLVRQEQRFAGPRVNDSRARLACGSGMLLDQLSGVAAVIGVMAAGAALDVRSNQSSISQEPPSLTKMRTSPRPCSPGPTTATRPSLSTRTSSKGKIDGLVRRERDRGGREELEQGVLGHAEGDVDDELAAHHLIRARTSAPGHRP